MPDILCTLLSAWILSVAVASPKVEATAAAPVALPTDVLLQQAVQAVKDEDLARADALVSDAMASPGFSRLPQERQGQVFAFAAAVASELGRARDASRLFSAATEFDGVDWDVWIGCADASLALEEHEEAARCISGAVQRWPTRVGDLEERTVAQLALALDDPDTTIAYRALVETLFDAQWEPEALIVDALWARLADLLIDAGQPQKAIKAVRRIDDPKTIVGLRVDRKFDPLARLHPGLFDVAAAIERTEREDLARAARKPRSLGPITTLHESRLQQRRYDEVLDRTEAIIANVRAGDGAEAYDDFDEHYVWVLDNRAAALAGAGRWDEAVRAREQAARRPEQGELNVSQVINLAQLYARLGRGQDARDALAEVGRMSPFGAMQRALMQLHAAVALDDKEGMRNAMAHLTTHRDDAPGALQAALVSVGDLDAAATLLIERLQRADWRSDALLAVQAWEPSARTSWDKTQARRWRSVLKRPDVQAAIDAVGRVERFPLASEFP